MPDFKIAMFALAVASVAAPARATGTALFLKGTVVTMDDKGTVVKGGGVVIRNGLIESVLAAGQAAPADAKVIDTKGRIYPGLINLHNHIAYNFLPLYAVPKKYDNRDQWPTGAAYEQWVNNPKTIVTDPGLFDRQTEVLKYAEIKSLVGGETTVQGSPQDAGSSTILVRNVELGNFGKDLVGQRGLPIDGLFTRDLANNQKSVGKLDAWLFHLSEGISDYSRREYFNAAYDKTKPPGSKNQAGLKNLGLVTKNLVGIHSAALTDADFADWATTAGSPPKVVWSPLSNLLLYGKTTNVLGARKAGGIVALGTDWSPSGSKNLLGELKIADEVNKQQLGNKLTARNLVEMVTCNPAKIVNWSDKVGTIKAGMVADLLVIDQVVADDYRALIQAKEENVQLVLVGGDPLYGDESWMKVLKPGVYEVIGNLHARSKALDLKRNVPKGQESFADIQKALLDALKYDPQALADVLNKGRGAGPTQFKPRSDLKKWLSVALTKVKKPMPADLGADGTPITKDSVALFLHMKFPYARPITALDPIYAQTDPAFFKGVKANIFFSGAAPVLKLDAFMKYLDATAPARTGTGG
jgi:hypothetical protein